MLVHFTNVKEMFMVYICKSTHPACYHLLVVGGDCVPQWPG